MANETLRIPTRESGLEYTSDMLYGDQKEVVTVVMNTLHDFMTMDDLSNFKPLRMIINGQGGSGKSVVINTIVTMMRKMFDYNEVVKVLAPTGTAAFNVQGETFHHYLSMPVKKSGDVGKMTESKRQALVAKTKFLMGLIVDERSLLSSRTLGTAEDMISSTIFEGGHINSKSWGGLPIVILVGDDYQLPGVGDGAFTALYSRYGSKMS